MVLDLLIINPGVVFSRKDIANNFGVSKNSIDRPLTDLIASGKVLEGRYTRPPHTDQNRWQYGYNVDWSNPAVWIEDVQDECCS